MGNKKNTEQNIFHLECEMFLHKKANDINNPKEDRN